MESDLLRGQQARAAWRSLSPHARASALAAAGRGVPPDDVGVAWAAAGYGRMVSRRLRIAWLLSPIVVIFAAVLAGVFLVADRASPPIIDVTMAVLLVAVLAGLLGLTLVARRYQRLYSSGLLGIEASRLGTSAPAPAASAWSVNPSESEFTVPYHAQLPLAHPSPTAVTDPVAAGVYEIPVRRGRILYSLIVMIAMAALLWSTALGLFDRVDETMPVLVTLVAVLAAFLTFFVILLLYAVGPSLRRRVAARFTPDGWELPPLRISGSWAEVRAIRVMPAARRGATAASPQMAAIRFIALIVDNPERRIAHLGRTRRALLRSNITKYGSPVVVVASPKRTLPVVEMVQLLKRYTDAPVEQT